MVGQYLEGIGPNGDVVCTITGMLGRYILTHKGEEYVFSYIWQAQKYAEEVVR